MIFRLTAFELLNGRGCQEPKCLFIYFPVFPWAWEAVNCHHFQTIIQKKISKSKASLNDRKKEKIQFQFRNVLSALTLHFLGVSPRLSIGDIIYNRSVVSFRRTWSRIWWFHSNFAVGSEFSGSVCACASFPSKGSERTAELKIVLLLRAPLYSQWHHQILSEFLTRCDILETPLYNISTFEFDEQCMWGSRNVVFFSK